MKETKSITHAKTTTKPEQIAPSPILYKTEEGARLYWDILGQGLPEGMEIIEPKGPQEWQRYSFQYAFIGGKNHHCVEITVDGADAGEHDIEWIYVRSYTGGQIRFIKPDDKAYALFAMAENDAYMFCENDPCIECAFACKVGFEFYMYSRSEGLLKDVAKIIYHR